MSGALSASTRASATTAVAHRRALFLVNPKSRRGAEAHDALRRRLADGGLTLVEPDPGHRTLAAAIRAHRADVDLVIVGGGDGTLNAAAPALVETQLPLGILPLGTANDLARTLGLPADPMAAADAILSLEAHRIDLGEVNGHLFFNVASIGFSAELAAELSAEMKRRWGKLGYALAAANLLRRAPRFTAFIEHDNTIEKVRTVQVSVGNGRHYGGGMAITDTATADDGMLDFYSLEIDAWWKLLVLLPSLRRGTHGRWREVRAFSTTELVIRTSRPRPVNTDGELTTWTPAHFRIRPAAIAVHAPARPVPAPDGGARLDSPPLSPSLG